MKLAAVCLVLLLSSLTLAAQNHAQDKVKTETPTVIDFEALPGNGCPIGMVATQGVWDHTIKVRQGQQEQNLQPFGQRIFLTLGDSHPAAIIAATVRVRGLTGENRKIDTAGDSDGDATKIMKVTFATTQKGRATGDLYIPGFTSVSSIELVEVSYGDGRVWRIGGSSFCRVTPDRMMLIANH